MAVSGKGLTRCRSRYRRPWKYGRGFWCSLKFFLKVFGAVHTGSRYTNRVLCLPRRILDRGQVRKDCCSFVMELTFPLFRPQVVLEFFVSAGFLKSSIQLSSLVELSPWRVLYTTL